MLRSFTLQNFQSFREAVQVSLELNRHTPEDGRSCTSALGTRLSKAMAVVGANASGKTTLIKSLVFVDWFVKHSFHAKPDEPIPLSAHFSATAEPSTFEVVFEYDGREWRYRLVASRDRVHHESLYSKQSRAFSYVFTRDWNPERKSYTVKQQHFGMLQKEAEKVRENASLISTAAQYEVGLALKLVSANVLSNVYGLGRQAMDHDQIMRASEFYAKNATIRSRMATLLQQWDFGLSDVRLEKHKVTRESGQSEEIHLPFGIHRVGSNEHPLMFLHESSGTQGAFILLSRILPALERGGLVVIDELEADLHPHMLTPILDLFFSSKTNPHNAQIIFTCHSMEVLSLLHKAQVVLVEKDHNCESDAWRLDSVKGVRADDNLYAKYMAGAYGAIPQL
jgi:ABC-type polar amino acid transport system ATPase subunit